MKDMSAQKQVCSIGTGGGAKRKPCGNAHGNMGSHLTSSMIWTHTKKALRRGSSLLDCLWGELYGSINIAEINDGAITHEHANYLRQKFLWGE